MPLAKSPRASCAARSSRIWLAWIAVRKFSRIAFEAPVRMSKSARVKASNFSETINSDFPQRLRVASPMQNICSRTNITLPASRVSARRHQKRAPLTASASFADAFDLFVDFRILRIFHPDGVVALHRWPLSYGAVDATSRRSARGVARCSNRCRTHWRASGAGCRSRRISGSGGISARHIGRLGAAWAARFVAGVVEASDIGRSSCAERRARSRRTGAARRRTSGRSATTTAAASTLCESGRRGQQGRNEKQFA
jgi:hypothetical protein